MIEVVRYGLAILALWLALRGIRRMWRARWRLTPAPVAYAALAGAALGGSLWLAVTAPETAAAAVGGALGWLVERSGLAAAWDAIVGWVVQRLADAVDAVLESLGLR